MSALAAVAPRQTTTSGLQHGELRLQPRPAGAQVLGPGRLVDAGAVPGRRARRLVRGDSRRAVTEVGAAAPTPSTRVGFLVAALLLRGLPPLPPGGSSDRLRIGAAVRGVGEGFAFLRTQPVLLMTFVVDIIAMTFAWPQAVFPELSQTRFAELAPTAWAGCSPASRSARWSWGCRRAGSPASTGRAPWCSRRSPCGAWRSSASASPRRCGWPCSASRSPAAADMVSAVLRTSMLQLAAPEEMRGRMQGVFIVVVAGGPRLGDLRAGALASATSVTVAMVSGGVVIVVAMIVVALVVPSFWLFRASRSAQEAGGSRPGSPAPESGEDRPGTSAD